MERQVITNFWRRRFASDEAEGLTSRIGDIRCTPVDEYWACMRDGDENISGVYDTHQQAMDWMDSNQKAAIRKELKMTMETMEKTCMVKLSQKDIGLIGHLLATQANKLVQSPDTAYIAEEYCSIFDNLMKQAKYNWMDEAVNMLMDIGHKVS